MSQNVVRRLRPYLFTNFRRLQCPQSRRTFSISPSVQKQAKAETHDRSKRVQELGQTEEALAKCYPRLNTSSEKRTSIENFRGQYDALENQETRDEEVHVAGTPP